MIKKLLLPFILGLLFFVGSVNADLNTSLVSYWGFETDMTDDVGIYDWINTGIIISTGKIGNGRNLDDGDYGLINSYPGSQDLTISFWYKFDTSTSGYEFFVTKGGTSYPGLNTDWGVYRNNDAGGLMTAWIGSGSNVEGFNSGYSDLTTTWHYLTFVVDQDAGRKYYYIDGSLVSNQTKTYTMQTTTDVLRLGRWSGGPYLADYTIDELGIWSRALNNLEVSELYNSGTGFAYPFSAPAVPLTMTIIKPTSDNLTIINWNDTIIPLEVSTNNNATCNYLYLGSNTTMSSTGIINHTDNLVIPTIFNESAVHEIGFRCEQTSTNESLNSSVLVTQLAKPFTFTIDTPTNGTNYTFDVENFWINLTTTYDDSSCSLNDGSQNISLNGDGENHSYYYNMGVAQNFTKQFNFNVSCDSPSSLNDISDSLTIFQQQVPIALGIFVPQDQQHFDFTTNLITFYIETNYVATCNYVVYNNVSIPIINESGNFTDTGNIIHLTNYSALFPSVRNYPLTFYCQGIFVNETINKSVTFFLDEEPISGLGNTLTITTGQLPQVGADVGGFLSGLTPGVIALIFILGIIAGIVAILGAIAKNTTNILGGKKR